MLAEPVSQQPQYLHYEFCRFSGRLMVTKLAVRIARWLVRLYPVPSTRGSWGGELSMQTLARTLVLLAIAMVSACAGGGLTYVDANHRPGQVAGAENFVAFVAVVRPHHTDNANLLKLERHSDDGSGFDFRHYQARPLPIGMDSLELFALELKAGTYSLTEMFDEYCYDCGYRVLLTLPFDDGMGTFTGAPGDVLMLGSVFLYERFRRVLSARSSATNVEEQLAFVRDAYPQLDFTKVRSGWDSAPDRWAESGGG